MPDQSKPMRLLKTSEVKARLGGISKTAFWQLRHNDPTFPRPVKRGVRCFYLEHELEAWIEAQAAKRDAA